MCNTNSVFTKELHERVLKGDKSQKVTECASKGQIIARSRETELPLIMWRQSLENRACSFVQN